MTFFAIFCPPIVALFVGGFWSFLGNLILCCLGWFPAVIHAMNLLNKRDRGDQHSDTMKAMAQQRDIMIMQMQMDQLQHMQSMGPGPAKDAALNQMLPRHLRKRKLKAA